jgi:hypothetical protein
MTSKKIDEAMMYCYTELYKNANPEGNFLDMLEHAMINSFGQKEIPFMDYEIEEEKFYEIIDDTIKKFKIKKYYHQPFKNSIVLGCSPKFKRK